MLRQGACSKRNAGQVSPITELLLAQQLDAWRMRRVFAAWREQWASSCHSARALAALHRHAVQRAVLSRWRTRVLQSAFLFNAAVRVCAVRRRNTLRTALHAWRSQRVLRLRFTRAQLSAPRARLRSAMCAWRVCTSNALARRWAAQHAASVAGAEASKARCEEARERAAAQAQLAQEAQRQLAAATSALVRAELRAPLTPGAPLLEVALRARALSPTGAPPPPCLCPAMSAALSDCGQWEDVLLCGAGASDSGQEPFAVTLLRTRLLPHHPHPHRQLPPGSDAATTRWMRVRVSGIAPGPREHPAACAVGARGSLLFLGGYDGHAERAEAYLLTRSRGAASADDDATGGLPECEWQGPLRSAGAHPGPRSHASLCPVPGGGAAFLFGGYATTEGALSELWMVNVSPPKGSVDQDDHGWAAPRALAWYRPDVLGEPPPARSGHAACVSPHDGCLYVHGGFDGVSLLADLHRFDPAVGAWECLLPWGVSPAPRRLHALVACGSQLLLHGGWAGGEGSDGDLSDCFALDLLSMTWRSLTLHGPAGPSLQRSAHGAVATVSGSVVLLGGVREGRLAPGCAPVVVENAAAADGAAMRLQALSDASCAALAIAARREAAACAASASCQSAAARREALHARSEAAEVAAARDAATEARADLAERLRRERERRKQAEAASASAGKEAAAAKAELLRRTAALEAAVVASDADAGALEEAMAARAQMQQQMEALQKERDEAVRKAFVAGAAAAAAEAARGAADMRRDQAEHALEVAHAHLANVQ